MDLTFTPEVQAFRQEALGFLAAMLPRRLAEKVLTDQRLTKADHEEWHGLLNARGWLADSGRAITGIAAFSS